MYHKNIELLLVLNVNFWIWSKEWILNDQNRRYILITVDYLLLVSRTDTVCWTERWVKVPKCALIRKLRNCLSQPFRTPTSFYMSLVNPRQNGCCVRSYFWFLRQSISDSFLSWPFIGGLYCVMAINSLHIFCPWQFRTVGANRGLIRGS